MSNAGSFAPAVIRGRLVRRRKTFTWKSARTATRSSPANRSWLRRRAASSDSRRNTPKRTRRLPPDCGREYSKIRAARKRRSRIEDRGSRIEDRAIAREAILDSRSSILDFSEGSGMSQEKEIIVGGQAAVEGGMMRWQNYYAVAVRRQDGSIVSKSERLSKLADKYPILKTPVLRGSAVLIHSMMLGVKALNFSAEVAFEDQVGEEAKPQAVLKAAAASGALMTTTHAAESPRPVVMPEVVEKRSKSEQSSVTATATGSIAFALVFNILLFIALPLLLTNFLFIYFGWGDAPRVFIDRAAASGAPWYYEIWMWLQAYMKPV